MKVVVIYGTVDQDDHRDVCTIVIDGKEEVSFLDGEREDASLNRDFNGVYSITDLMKRAFIAGKSNDSFELENVKVNSWEEYDDAIDEYVED